ncbi:hypothetical protein [Flavilitoribacter nigricans]|uniref:Uncharacterized protein n=1 Tax=Flavilitoribacter nigricans (strain ATCC 23147 / DSM 23189 / NBRC 102662 / NCIMB 1420 / SS-2) TaxID=1122177 RepID=A0A2D0MXY6_FLAN2|nr:hypothetical protein [Flavilitoribacter nigricans]PHN01142.1 hypothetical protein CRP01_38715 [Flavilitoribacter nigricans DSM 23189 = NBRC 102662]
MRFKTKDVYKGIYSSHQRLKDAATRMGLTLINDEALSLETYVKLLQGRMRTAQPDVKQEVEKRLAALNASHFKVKPHSTLNGHVKLHDRQPEIHLIWYKRITIRAADFLETVADFATSKAIVFLTLVAALSIQVHHLAHLVNKVGLTDNLFLGYIFGSVSELTALMLTVHKARKYMLIAFALVQAWINILYYCELPLLITKLTLSLLIAFVIFSYSEIYTDSHKV